MIDPNDGRLTYVPIEKATTPPVGLIRHIKDSWHAVHPERGLLLFRGVALQNNQNRAVAERLFADLYPWAEVRQIPHVYLSINPADYCGH